MVEKANMTAEEFERRRQQPRSKWGGLIEDLRKANVGTVFPVPIEETENNGPGRERARQGVRAIAKYHGLSVKFLTDDGVLLVAKAADGEATQ